MPRKRAFDTIGDCIRMRCGKVAFLRRVRGIPGKSGDGVGVPGYVGDWQHGPQRGREGEACRPSTGRLDDHGGKRVKKERAPRHVNIPIEGPSQEATHHEEREDHEGTRQRNAYHPSASCSSRSSW